MSRKTGLSMNRRTFVGSALAGMSVLGLNAEVPKPPSGSIPMREFGKTGVKLTIVGQAGARLALCRTREAAGKVVLHAYGLGINYFDCAHSYWAGHSEETYGDVLPPFRKNIFITTKSGQRTREGAEKDLHASLAAMKTDYLDLWQVHGIQDMADVDKVFAPGGCIEAFEAAKAAGSCRQALIVDAWTSICGKSMVFRTWRMWPRCSLPEAALRHSKPPRQRANAVLLASPGTTIRASTRRCSSATTNGIPDRKSTRLNSS